MNKWLHHKMLRIKSLHDQKEKDHYLFQTLTTLTTVCEKDFTRVCEKDFS